MAIPADTRAPRVPEDAGAGVLERLVASADGGAIVEDVRIGLHWTAVVVRTAGGPRSARLRRAGLASTQAAAGAEHGTPTVTDAGKLADRPAADLLALMTSENVTERGVGFAALNACLPVDTAACVEENADALLMAHGWGRPVAVVGHFPFVPELREVAGQLWVLELKPREGDVPAELASEILPQADVVAITAMTLVNRTFEPLVRLCRRDALVVLLGPTTPLSPILFDYGVDVLSGTRVVDIPAVLAAVSQGANFRQVPGRRLLTLPRAGLQLNSPASR